jgi:hypothetical protein
LSVAKPTVSLVCADAFRYRSPHPTTECFTAS